jgi:hypothetical protein
MLRRAVHGPDVRTFVEECGPPLSEVSEGSRYWSLRTTCRLLMALRKTKDSDHIEIYHNVPTFCYFGILFVRATNLSLPDDSQSTLRKH